MTEDEDRGGRKMKKLKFAMVNDDWGEQDQPGEQDERGGGAGGVNDRGACKEAPKTPSLPKGRRGLKRKVSPN